MRKLSDFFSFFKFRFFLLIANLLFILDLYIYIINQKHVYEVNLKSYISINNLINIIMLIGFYFIIIQILYFLFNFLTQLIKIKLIKQNSDFQDGVFLNKLRLYSIRDNNIVAFNFLLKVEKELEEQYQTQVLAFGFIVFFIYSIVTKFKCFLLMGIKNSIIDYFCGVSLLLIILFCVHISLCISINRNYIYDKELKDILKEEK